MRKKEGRKEGTKEETIIDTITSEALCFVDITPRCHRHIAAAWKDRT